MVAVLIIVISLTVRCYGVYSLPKNCVISYNTQGEATSVDCSNKNLTSIPTDIPPTVNNLNFHQNNIAFIPNNTFEELLNLTNLDLSFNHLTQLEANVFRGLTSLGILNLSRNRIPLNIHSYPVTVFGDLGQLISLNLRNNTDEANLPLSTQYPDVALSSLTNLSQLKMDGIFNLSLGNGFRQLVNLEVLDFSGYDGYCNLVNISEDMFSNIRTRHPLKLNISQCYIHYIHPQTFRALPTLEVLDLEDNSHFRFKNFMIASESFSLSLKVLNISFINIGRLITVHWAHFQHLHQTSLTTIIMERNKITCLDPVAVSYLPSTVKYVSLRDNKLMDGKFLLHVIFMPSLEILDIGRQIYYTAKISSWFSLRSVQKSKEYCDRDASLENKTVAHDRRNVLKLYDSETHDASISGDSSVGTESLKVITSEDTSTSDDSSVGTDSSNVSTSGNYSVGSESPKVITSDDSSTFRDTLEDPSTGMKSRVFPLHYGDEGSLIRSRNSSSQLGSLRTEEDVVHMVIPSNEINSKTKESSADDSSSELTESPCYPAYSGFHIDIIPLPPNLHTLEADNIKLGYAIPNVTFAKSNSLHLLNLSSDLLYCFGGPVYGLHELNVFDLSSNQCNDVSPIFFTDMPKLTHLYLHENNLGQSLSSDLDGQTFSSQTVLRFLGLGKNRIHSLPSKMFINLENLERLVLKENSLSSLGARIGHMRNLALLDLSQNEFVAFDGDLRHDLDQISLFNNITVDITDNPLLECSCDTFEFVQWITETKVVFKNFNETFCHRKEGSVVPFQKLKDMIVPLWMECNRQMIFTVVLSMFVVVLFVVGLLGTLYYKRWKLRYLYYIGRRRVNPYNTLGTPVPVERVLDVFVSYDEDDRGQRTFVQEELLPKLEAKHISCLISEIHFLCGRNTREIIVEAVLGTRKTLALLTNDFFKSRDRELEFNMAVLHGMETRQDLVIPVAMEMLVPENIPTEVRVFLKAYPCIQYREGDAAFWEELVSRLYTCPD